MWLEGSVNHILGFTHVQICFIFLDMWQFSFWGLFCGAKKVFLFVRLAANFQFSDCSFFSFQFPISICFFNFSFWGLFFRRQEIVPDCPTNQLSIFRFFIFLVFNFQFLFAFSIFNFSIWGIFAAPRKCSWLSDQRPTFNFLTVLLGDTLTLMSSSKFGNNFLSKRISIVHCHSF